MNFNFPQDYEVNKYMGYDIVSLTLSTFTAQNGQNVTQGHPGIVNRTQSN